MVGTGRAAHRRQLHRTFVTRNAKSASVHRVPAHVQRDGTGSNLQRSVRGSAKNSDLELHRPGCYFQLCHSLALCSNLGMIFKYSHMSFNDRDTFQSAGLIDFIVVLPSLGSMCLHKLMTSLGHVVLWDYRSSSSLTKISSYNTWSYITIRMHSHVTDFYLH